MYLGYKIPETGGYALEYARGWIPAMLRTSLPFIPPLSPAPFFHFPLPQLARSSFLAFGFLDIFTSNLDFYTFFRTLWLYANSVIPELLQGKF